MGSRLALGAWLCCLAAVAPQAALGDDRLDRLRALVAARSLEGEATTGADGSALARSLWRLLDEEVLENLESGPPFASAAFIQERLEAFSEVWGAASLRLERAGTGPTELLVGTFALSVDGRGAVRLYGRVGGKARLRGAVEGDGVPAVVQWPATRRGDLQWLIAWSGPPAGGARRPVGLELWRLGADGPAATAWTSRGGSPQELWASEVRIGTGTVLVRYEARYPGWKSGCEGQAEHEDVYRYDVATDRMQLVRRRTHHGWHVGLHAEVTRFFAALARADGHTLAELVPDRRLRARLPPQLGPEPACDAQDPEVPGRVVVAATETRDARPVAWSLWWARSGAGWRLVAAAPVLE